MREWKGRDQGSSTAGMSHLAEAAKIYKVRQGFHIKKDRVQEYGRFLDQLSEKYKQLTAEITLKESTPKTAPTHEWFQWDNSLAAKEYRLTQARSLMRAIIVVQMINGEEVEARQFYNVSVREIEDGDSIPTENGLYISSGKVLSDTELRSRLLERARLEALAWRRRYAQLTELSKVFEIIDSL